METTNLVINAEKICRSCLSDEGEMTSIFDTINPDNVTIIDMLESCSFLQAERDDGMPSQICFQCYTVIQQAYEFKLQCQKSEAVIKSYLSVEVKDIKILKLENLEQEEFEVMNEDSFPAVENESISEVPVLEKNSEDKKIFECVDCNENFLTNEDLSAHKIAREHFSSKCTKCLKTFKDDNVLNVHLRNCEIHECNFCKKKFRTAGYLQNHLKKHDPNFVPEEKKFKCTECDKSYTSPANLTIHQYSHSGIKPFKCEFCGRGFTKMISLNAHHALHTGKRAYLCNECGRGFTSNSVLNQHKKIHSGEKPFKCTHCTRRFTASGDLTIHLRCHTGEKPYLCPTCGRAFTRITHLNTHIRTHTGERPYICGECGKSFVQSGDLRSHQRIHTGERPYGCNICSKRFVQSSGLASHMATHSGIKAHVCNVCNRAFSQASSLLRHVKAHS